MKKVFLWTAVATSMLVPFFASAADLHGGREYTLRREEVVNGDLYVGGGSVAVSGTVEGDLVAGAGTILVSGTVRQSLMVAGGSLTLSGTVGDDIRAVGGTIIVSGTVTGDVVVLGGQVHILSDATIAGDVIVLGGNLTIDGTVHGTVRATGGEVTLNGMIGKDAVVRGGAVTVGQSAVLGGNLEYTSPREATIAGGAKITGARIFHKKEVPVTNTGARSIVGALIGLWAIGRFLMLLLAGILMLWAFPTLSREIIGRGRAEFLKSCGRGFIILIVIPAAAIVACVTLIGIPLGILAFLIYGALLLIAMISGTVLAGAWLESLIPGAFKKNLTWKTIVIGALAFALIGLIPFVGAIFKCLFMLAALGAFGKQWHEKIWLHR